MKRILPILLAALSLSACSPVVTDVHVASASEPPPGISVTGSGEARAKPDVAHANIGVDVRSSTVQAAVSEGNQRMAAVVAALKGIGVAENDLQTHDFSIQYERLPEPPPDPRPTAVPTKPGAPVVESAKVAGPPGEYHVTNLLSVTVRDFTKIGPVFDAAINAGANNVWGLAFELDDPKPLRAQARAKAVADARQRAEELARSSGTALGTIRSVEEIETAGVIGYGVARMAAQEAQGVPIESGQVSTTVQVHVIFDLAGQTKK